MTDRYTLLDADGNVCNIIQWDGVEAHEETETWTIEDPVVDDDGHAVLDDDDNPVTETVEYTRTRVIGWSPPEGCKVRPWQEGDVIATSSEPAEQTAANAKADLAQRLATTKATTLAELKRLLTEWAEGN